MKRLLPAALTMLALATALAAQDGSGCRSCDGHGVLDCKSHPKGMLDKERAVQRCSVASECKACTGALQTDCRTCRNPAAEADVAHRRQLATDWLQARRKAVDEVTRNQPLMHLATAHFDLTFSVRPLTVGRDKLDSHQLMHLYGERLEALRALFLQTLEVTEQDQTGRLQVLMFRDLQDHTLMAPRVTGFGGGGSLGQKLMGPADKGESVYCMYHDVRAMADDEALHRNIVHNVTHLLLANLPPVVWLGNRRHGWIDEGLAHWFEDKVTGRCANFCYEEVLLQPGMGWKNGRWRAPVRRMVDAGKHRSFADLSQRNTDQLEFEDHALAFAYVDFLLTRHGGKAFTELARKVKGGAETRDALQAVYKLDPLTIEEVFRTWVKENYSPQDSH